MSKITLTPHASGTGTLNIAAPNTNSTRTLTLPDADLNLGNVLTTSSSVDAANLTGALPAISGAALTGIATGMVYDLLGTIATTSGSTATLSGLTLTSYKFLHCIFDTLSGDATGMLLLLNGWTVIEVTYNTVADYGTGTATIDLASGIFSSSGATFQNAYGNYAGKTGNGGSSGVTTASTSISFTLNSGAFDAGSIKIYGMA